MKHCHEVTGTRFTPDDAEHMASGNKNLFLKALKHCHHKLKLSIFINVLLTPVGQLNIL